MKVSVLTLTLTQPQGVKMKVSVLTLALTAPVLALLAGCGKAPMADSPTNNPEIKVERLFDHEGCTVYRFFDYGSRVYYTKCDSQSRTTWEEFYQCGKSTCRKTKEVTTNLL